MRPAEAAVIALLAIIPACSASADLRRLSSLRERLEDPARGEARSADETALKQLVAESGDGLLAGMALSPHSQERALGRFVLAADPGAARRVYSRLRDAPDESVRLQARLLLDAGPPPGAFRPEEARIDRHDLDGDGRAELAVTRVFCGAYGRHAELLVLGGGERPEVSRLTASDGSIRWIEYEGRPAALVSEIHAQGEGGRAVAWAGVIAIRHDLYAWREHGLKRIDRFFTPFDGTYP